MEQVWLWTNQSTWRAYRLLRLRVSGRLFERYGLRSHGAQADEQECRREPLTIHLAVYLARRFLDSQLLEHPRKLFVADFATHHLLFYQPLRFFFPLLVGLARRSVTVVRQFFHRSLSTLLAPLFFWDWKFLTAIFGRIRPTQNRQRYTSLANHICEDRMPTKSLQTNSPTRRPAAVSRTNSQANSRLHAPAGGAK